MSGTELIMGMEEVVQHIRELEEREKNLKEALAKKFYDHYDDMNYNKLNIARTVGPNLGRMIEHLIKENKRLQEENMSLQEENEQKDADWNDWLNGAFGDDLYPISPSPEPDEFVEKVKKLQEENAKYEENNPRCLVYEVEKLGEMVDDEREMVKEKARILANYRSAMCDIENWNEDLECINDILPHLKKLKEEIKKLKEENGELEGKLEQAKEVAYHCGVELFDDSDDESSS